MLSLNINDIITHHVFLERKRVVVGCSLNQVELILKADMDFSIIRMLKKECCRFLVK